MKQHLLTLAIGIFMIGCISAKPVGTITFGKPHKKVFPADGGVAGIVYIELPVTVTNTSKETIYFGTLGGPQFKEFVQRKLSSRHWSEITVRGMCGMGYSLRSLEPGESLETTVLIDPNHGGHGYRLELPIEEAGSSPVSRAKIKSKPIVIPRIKG